MLLKKTVARYQDMMKEDGEDASDHSLSSWIRRPFATKTGAVSNVDVNITPTFIDVHRQFIKAIRREELSKMKGGGTDKRRGERRRRNI